MNCKIKNRRLQSASNILYSIKEYLIYSEGTVVFLLWATAEATQTKLQSLYNHYFASKESYSEIKQSFLQISLKEKLILEGNNETQLKTEITPKRRTTKKGIYLKFLKLSTV